MKKVIILCIMFLTLCGFSIPIYAKEEKKEDISKVTFLAIGDVLLHKPVYNSFYKNGVYNFDEIFKAWENDIKNVDFACVNQETIFVDKKSGYTSYPSFGSPSEIGETEIKYEFDIITHATNHTFDRGKKGLNYTFDFWKDKPILVLGINETKEQNEMIDVIEKNGIKFSFLNFTYGLNGYSLPKGEEYLVNLIDNENKWLEKIRNAKEQSEVMVCFIHIGTEYAKVPNKNTISKIEQAIDSGADIIVCAHPHVIEPFGVYETSSGNRALVYWSLGNFISNQQDLSTNLGGVAKFTIEKNNETKEIKITEATLEGTINQNDSNGYRAIPLSLYTEELAKAHKFYKKYANFSKKSFEDIFEENKTLYKDCGNTLNIEENLPIIIE